MKKGTVIVIFVQLVVDDPVLGHTVKNYLHGLHGFVASSQKFVVYNRPMEKSKRSKFPWSKLQRVCTKLYNYIVFYYAKFGVKFGKS